MSRLLSWFSTKSGRTFTHCCVGAAALTVFGTKSAIHGPLMDKLKDVCQVYQHKKPRPLPPNVNDIIEEVLYDSSLNEQQKKKLKFFYVMGHQPFHAGGIDSPWGAIIGIPFFFEDMKDFKISDLRLPGKETVDWIIDGRDLLDSLVMSDSAKKFALMREIYSCNFVDALTDALMAAICVIIPAKFAQRTNVTSKAFEKLTLRQRFVRYSLFYVLGYFLYRLVKDPRKHLSDQKADSLAAETGSEYLDGGIEYYQKTLKKNKALEDLSNSRFMRTYDEKGSENYFLLAPKLPVSKRLENLQKMKREKIVKVEENDSK